MTATLYYRAAAAQAAPPEPPAIRFDRADGRCARILRAVSEQPMKLGDLNRQVRREDAGRTMDAEKHMTLQAVRFLIERGYLISRHDGYEPTRSGRQKLADVEAGGAE